MYYRKPEALQRGCALKTCNSGLPSPQRDVIKWHGGQFTLVGWLLKHPSQPLRGSCAMGKHVLGRKRRFIGSPSYYLSAGLAVSKMQRKSSFAFSV